MIQIFNILLLYIL